MSCSECGRGAALDRAVGVLAEVVARLRADDPRGAAVGRKACPDCGYDQRQSAVVFSRQANGVSCCNY
jgi:hypothetical protein